MNDGHDLALVDGAGLLLARSHDGAQRREDGGDNIDIGGLTTRRGGLDGLDGLGRGVDHGLLLLLGELREEGAKEADCSILGSDLGVVHKRLDPRVFRAALKERKVVKLAAGNERHRQQEFQRLVVALKKPARNGRVAVVAHAGQRGRVRDKRRIVRHARQGKGLHERSKDHRLAHNVGCRREGRVALEEPLQKEKRKRKISK